MLAREPRARRVVWGFLDFGEGGAQRATLLTLRHLSRERFAPALLLARGGGALEHRARASGVPVVACGRLRRPWDGGAPAALGAALAALAPAALEVPLYSRASPYLRLAALRAGVPLVVAHEWERGAAPGLARRLVDRLLRPTTRFLSVSQHHARRLVDSGVPAERVAVVRNGIEVERFAAGDRAAARASLALADGVPLLLVPARLHPAKGHRDLLAALPEIRRSHPGVQVRFAGDGPERAALERLAREADLDGAVRCLGHREDLPDLLAASDLIVLPSRAEGLPAALLEALAAGRAVVATAVGGVPEAIQDGRQGRLVPPAAPAPLAAAIVELLGSAAARAELGGAGQARVRRHYRVESATRRLEAVLETWLDEVGAGSRARAA